MALSLTVNSAEEFKADLLHYVGFTGRISAKSRARNKANLARLESVPLDSPSMSLNDVLVVFRTPVTPHNGLHVQEGSHSATA